MIKTIKALLFISVLPAIHAQSQEISKEVVSSSGDYYEASATSVSWTLGEIAVETYDMGNTVVYQGFQQLTYEVTTLSQEMEYDIPIRVYPVPSSDFITVELKEFHKDMQIILYNLQGEIIATKQAESSTVTFDLNNLSPSVYILKIVNKENYLIRSFKIVKY